MSNRRAGVDVLRNPQPERMGRRRRSRAPYREPRLRTPFRARTSRSWGQRGACVLTRTRRAAKTSPASTLPCGSSGQPITLGRDQFWTGAPVCISGSRRAHQSAQRRAPARDATRRTQLRGQGFHEVCNRSVTMMVRTTTTTAMRGQRLHDDRRDNPHDHLTTPLRRPLPTLGCPVRAPDAGLDDVTTTTLHA